MLWSFWLIAGTISFGLFLVTTIPAKSGIFFTDRARFQRLISKNKEGECEEALLEIITQSTKDGSYKNISLKDAQLLQTDNEAFVQFWGYYYEYEYFKDNEDSNQVEKAKEKLFNLKNTISAPIWKALKLE